MSVIAKSTQPHITASIVYILESILECLRSLPKNSLSITISTK